MYSVIMGHLGSDMVAANAVVVVARNLGTVLCFGIANAGGILIFLLRPVFMNMSDLSAVSQGYLNIMLFINMYYVIGQAMNSAVISGIFRAGGDSRWGFICDFIDMWVYFLICTDEFVKLPFVYRHYKSYKWLKNITREF